MKEATPQCFTVVERFGGTRTAWHTGFARDKRMTLSLCTLWHTREKVAPTVIRCDGFEIFLKCTPHPRKHFSPSFSMVPHATHCTSRNKLASRFSPPLWPLFTSLSLASACKYLPRYHFALVIAMTLGQQATHFPGQQNYTVLKSPYHHGHADFSVTRPQTLYLTDTTLKTNAPTPARKRLLFTQRILTLCFATRTAPSHDKTRPGRRRRLQTDDKPDQL